MNSAQHTADHTGSGSHGCGGHGAGGCSGSGERAAFRASLAPTHPVAVLMDEHLQILGKLDAVTAAAARLDTEREAALTELAALSATLIGAEPHHAREEQVLFPALRERGMHGPPDVMEHEHVDIRAMKHGLGEQARALLSGDGGSLPKLRALANNLAVTLREHIGKEDTILYPMAVAIIQDPAQWEQMRLACDELGYCCHAPSAADAGGCGHHD